MYPEHMGADSKNHINVLASSGQGVGKDLARS